MPILHDLKDTGTAEAMQRFGVMRLVAGLCQMQGVAHFLPDQIRELH
jgi:hypothetical protein